MNTGQYKTVWDLAGDWGWTQFAKGFRLKGGSVVWEQAENNNGQKTVKISRIEVYPCLKQVTKYIDPDTEIEFILN